MIVIYWISKKAIVGELVYGKTDYNHGKTFIAMKQQANPFISPFFFRTFRVSVAINESLAIDLEAQGQQPDQCLFPFSTFVAIKQQANSFLSPFFFRAFRVSVAINESLAIDLEAQGQQPDQCLFPFSVPKELPWSYIPALRGCCSSGAKNHVYSN